MGPRARRVIEMRGFITDGFNGERERERKEEDRRLSDTLPPPILRAPGGAVGVLLGSRRLRGLTLGLRNVDLIRKS